MDSAGGEFEDGDFGFLLGLLGGLSVTNCLPLSYARVGNDGFYDAAVRHAGRLGRK